MRLFMLAALAALASPAAAPAGAPAASSTLPVEDLAEIPFFSGPAMSPDGARIAARINVEGRELLAIYELAAGPKAQPTFVPLGPFRASWFSWAGNDRLLIGYLTVISLNKRGYFGLLPATRVARYEVSTAKMIEVGAPLGMLGDDVIFTDPWGRYVLLSAQEDITDSPSVQRVDLATGASVEMQPKRSDIWNWFSDAEGNVRGGISYVGNGFIVYYRNHAGGELKRTARTKIPFDESTVDSLHILPGGNKGVLVTNAPTGRFGVYEYELGSPEVGAAIFEHPEAEVAAVQFTADGSTVAAVSYEDDRLRTKWMLPELQQVQAQIDRTFAGKDNRIIGGSQDGKILLVWSGAADDPGTFYVFDRKTRRMNAFASPYVKLIDAAFSPVKPARYAARDGLSIPSYLTLPRGRAPTGLPLIVMPHGGPFARDSFAFNPWVQFLASRGYAVLQPNFRGSTGFGRAHVERGYGAWGTAMQDDIDDGVAWLAKEGVIDPQRVCIMGASYGGYAALWGAIRNPDIYRCAISFAAVSDVRAMLKHDSSMLIARRYSKQWRKRIEGEEKRDLAAVSPLQQAARLNVPVLVAHGMLDMNVPFDQSKKMVAALRSRGAPVISAYYPRAGHGFDRTEDSVDFLRRVEAFLEIHNPSDLATRRGRREAQLVGGKVEPSDYPPEAAKKKQQGQVDLNFVVGRDGRITSCRVATSSGFPLLDAQSCAVVEERFQYRPALSAEGVAVDTQETYKLRWRLPENVPAPAGK